MKALVLSSVLLIGLATAVQATPTAGVPAASEGARRPAIAVSQDGLANRGVVQEAIPVDNYTYLRVTQDGKDTWLAIPRRDVPVGAEIRYGKGNVMKDFHSSTLDRTFEEVVFLAGVIMADETPLQVPPGHPVVPADPTAQENLPNVGQVSEAIRAGSYTYLHVTQDGKDTWLAIPQRDVPVGARIRYADGMLMKDFHSSALDRKFAEVYFLGGVLVTGH